MKKVLILLVLICLALPAFAAEWFEIFEKQYLHLTTIEPNYNTSSVYFWVKTLRKEPNDKFPNQTGKMVDYWYTMSKWHIDCENKKERIEMLAVYDLKQKPIYWDEDIPEWNTIVPDTYADGFYRLFCLVPFQDNPLLNKE